MPGLEDSNEECRQQVASEELGELLAGSGRERWRRIAAARLSDPSGAEDVVQEASLAFYRAYDGCEGGNPRAYFYAALISRVSHANRRSWRKPAPVPLAPEASQRAGAADRFAALDELLDARVALAGLEERDRQAVGLRALGFTTDEIAAATRVSPRVLR